jgi:hypothetical protein
MVPNGLGPWWFSAKLRARLTAFSRRFFNEASWEKHDIGYAAGAPSRAVCDRKFLQAMLRDASQVSTTGRVFGCLFLAVLFWLLVRAFGWASYGRKGKGAANV